MFIFSLPIIIIMAAAIVPGIFLMKYVYKMDRLEKESNRMLVRLFIAGIISTILAVFTETIGMQLLDSTLGSGVLYEVLLNFIVIGLSEEGFKFLMVKKSTWKSPEFNCSFDGIVYAVFVSMGFAVWENIQYVFSYGLMTALVRAVTAMPGHACFGVIMGAFYGLAKKRECRGDLEGSKKALRNAVLFPMLAHGAYDITAGMSSWLGTIIFIVIIAALYFLCFNLVKGLSDGDTYLGPNRDSDFVYVDVTDDEN